MNVVMVQDKVAVVNIPEGVSFQIRGEEIVKMARRCEVWQATTIDGKWFELIGTAVEVVPLVAKWLNGDEEIKEFPKFGRCGHFEKGSLEWWSKPVFEGDKARVKFEMGKWLATPGVMGLDINPIPFFAQHSVGHWGTVCQHDWRENEYSLDKGLRLFSAYQVGEDTKFWVITEADRSATTILLPSEY